MRKSSLGWLAAVLLVGLLVAGCAAPCKEVKTGAMSVIVATPVLELSKTAKAEFYGTGFAPKQELQFLFKDSGGFRVSLIVRSVRSRFQMKTGYGLPSGAAVII